MGYKRETKVFKLVFTEPEFDGLIVRCKSLPLGRFLEMEELTKSDVPDKEKLLIEGFVETIIDWNLEDENDVPVPTTYEGLKSQDMDFVKALINAWKVAVVGVDAPLVSASSNGGTSLEASLPMVPLSQSRAS